MGKDIKSPPVIGRIAIIVLGIIIMGVGLHSHFESVWSKDIAQVRGGTIKYRDWACTLLANPQNKACPSLSLEQFYVSIVIITFIISLLGLIAFFLMDLSKFKLIDVGYHAVAAVFLFMAAICHIVSAAQIHKLARGDPLRHGEKMAAGALTIIQAMLYGVVAFLIWRQ